MKYFILLLLFPTLICARNAKHSQTIEFYGQTVILTGTAEFRTVANPLEHTFENIWVLKLDKPITQLPMPKIGEEKRTIDKIVEVILYMPQNSTPAQINLFQENQHLRVKGSIWYADWWFEEFPFMLVVDALTQA